jgi:hypothetical protein
MERSEQDPPDAMPDWYDPFAEPRTLPSGWDAAGWSAAPAQPLSERHARPAAMRSATPLQFPIALN